MATNHDPTKVMLGSITTSDRTITSEAADPTTFVAGLAVRRTSTGGLVLADDSTAALIGVSLGPDLSDTTARTLVARAGDGVPLRLTDESVAATLVKDKLTFTARHNGADGDDISVVFAAGGTAGNEVVTVTGNKISVSMATSTSTCTQLKSKIDASAAAMLLIMPVTIASGQGATAQAAFAEANLAGGADSYPYAELGATVKVDDTTGMASSDGDDTNATYVSEALTGVLSDGTTATVALLDMAGGL